ncbi:MAG: hypothetical protein ABW034_00180 [Steroidobacteraceae bacterium]
MNVSVQHLLKAVSDSLEREVLPHLESQAAPASNVRSCLMLLANIEARVTHEARFLFDDNRELRVLLADAAGHADILGLDNSLRDALKTALQDYPPQDTWFDANAAARENHDYQALLTRLIESVAGQDAKGEFKTQLHAYLHRLGQRDIQLAANALMRTPV